MATKTSRVRKAQEAPYQCPLYLSPDDVKALRAQPATLVEIATLLKEVKEMTVDNHNTLRGHNGDPGLIADIGSRFTALEQQIADATTALEALKNVPTELADVTRKVDALKDVPAAVATWQRYPPLTWLVTHKFKEFAIITVTAVVVTITFGFPNSYSGEQLRQIIELLVAKYESHPVIDTMCS